MAKRAHSEDEGDDSVAAEGSHNSGGEEYREASPPQNKRPKKTPVSKADKENGDKKGKKKTEDSEGSSTGGKSKKGNSAKVLFTNSEGEKFVDLGNKRRATVRRFNGKTLIDIREFYGDVDDLKPGKKGISLSVEQWGELKANASTIETLIKKI